MGESAHHENQLVTDHEAALSVSELAALRPHVVDLQDGHFATTAKLNTTAADIDAIFEHHLPDFIASRGGGPVAVMFWAHGGLVSERAALAVAQRDIPWWRSNGIYPIHFVWHTGLWETLGDMLADSRKDQAGAPGPELVGFTDTIIEDVVRGAGGPAVWQAMKNNARRASQRGGGAAYVATALSAFVAAHPLLVTVHAAGHSAGSNFHGHFIPAVVRGGVNVKTCQLLVPSLRVDTFKEGMLPLLGAGIGALSMFGMNVDVALADSSFGLYRKSLLYLIRDALEEPAGAPILGLQQCVSQDPVLSALFAVAPAKGVAEAIWSLAVSGPPSARSTATTHTGFDDDIPTMDSVVRRILGRDAIVSFGTTQHAAILAKIARQANVHKS
ncbi:hypothetical protein [Arthrobacter cryoconiti]|uniref:Uncharacterized protein n=1 Tax=Arthrobacter cryoconiti TaxID=748907 RepID=A0ABV8QZG5_9MICC|nr:hypothetical protein [Arthrobacter cryoconiti]MCC9068654.1 hypothetical protein [Arthrobacter cryoconiti]